MLVGSVGTRSSVSRFLGQRGWMTPVDWSVKGSFSLRRARFAKTPVTGANTGVVIHLDHLG